MCCYSIFEIRYLDRGCRLALAALQYEEKSSMCSCVLRNFLAFAHCEESTKILHSAEKLT